MKWSHIFALFAAFLFMCGGYALAQGSLVAALGGVGLGLFAMDMVFYAVRRERQS